VRVTEKGVVARITGVTDRTQAEALRGTELFVERHLLPAAAEGEFYHADLIGLTAADPEGQTLGDVIAVQNFGGGDLLEIRLVDSGKTEFVAFTDDFVPTIDLARGIVTVVMDLPKSAEKPPAGGKKRKRDES
jgi:16S rRNA processing protein RimM